jgi:Signal transduction histidine kinase
VSIRVKLYMSYLAMAFVPVLLMMLLALFIFYLAGKEDLREFSEKHRNESFNQALIYGELSYVIREDTGKLENETFMDDLQRRLEEQWAGLLVARDGKLTEVPPFLRELSPEEDWQSALDSPPRQLKFNLFRYDVHEIEFTFPDGADGKAVLLNRAESIPWIWNPIVLIVSLVFICLTSLLLTYFVSRSIIKPLQSLRTAALRIKEGDLSQPVDLRRSVGRYGRINEVAQLSTAFEEMRGRLKQSIDQSLQYEENRKQLLSHISHDLKTPISAIKGYVEGIMDGIANTEEKRSRYIGTIYRKAEEMDKLIDELFLFSKLDLQTVAFDFKVVDLNRYVEHFMDEQRFDLEKSGIRLQFEPCSGGPVMAAADTDKLNRVLTNILNNSVKYMGDGSGERSPLIQVTIKTVPHWAIVEIEDTGPGIDNEDLPYIFDRFYRAEQSRNSETGGSGLGLAIVKQIMEGHGGEAWAENAENGGARFCLKLPLAMAGKAVNEHEEHPDHRG